VIEPIEKNQFSVAIKPEEKEAIKQEIELEEPVLEQINLVLSYMIENSSVRGSILNVKKNPQKKLW